MPEPVQGPNRVHHKRRPRATAQKPGAEVARSEGDRFDPQGQKAAAYAPLSGTALQRLAQGTTLRSAAPAPAGSSAAIASTPAPLTQGQIDRVLFGHKLDIRVNWKKRLEVAPSENPSQEQPAYSLLPTQAGTLIVNGTRGTYGVQADGKVAWTLPTGYAPNAPKMAADGTLYVASQYDRAHPDETPMLSAARDDGQGMRLLWQRTLEPKWPDDGTPPELHRTIPWFPPTVGQDGRLYAPSQGRLLRFEADGTRLADLPHEGLQPNRVEALADGRLVLHDSQGAAILDARDVQNPRVESTHSWQKEWPVHFEPDGTSFWWKDHTLRCVAPDRQTERWSYTFPEEKGSFAMVQVAKDGSLRAMRQDMFLGTRVTALAADGSFMWEWTPVGDRRWLGTTPELAKMCLAEDGTAYFSGADRIYAVGADGQEKWAQRYEEDCNEFFLGPQDTLVLGQPSTHPRILSRKDGELLYEGDFQLAHGYPCTATMGDTVYTVDKNWQLVSIGVTDILQAPPEALPTQPPGRVERETEYVIINGVRVPVRNS